jgi:hypothetical protein
MGKRYQNNMADQDLIVRSIKVLESIDGGGMKEIRQDIERVRQNTSIQIKQQEEYWKSLSDDGVITTIEKQSLKREMENIRQSFGAVTQQAASFGYTNPILQDYVNTYNALYEYIYETLALFDDMTTDTEISDRDTFNEYFSNYFFLENFILLAITKGVLDTLQFRVLESLNEPGEEGETALYHGGLYQYTDGRWKSVSTGNYKGAKSELPAAEEDSFFLASETFVMTDILIVNDTELLVNGEELMLSHQYIKGYIYYVVDGIWNVEEDKTNWRYAAAFADVLNVTGELPQIFQDGLDALQAQIDAVSGNLTDEIAARQGQYTIINGEIVEINGDITAIINRADAQAATISDQQDQINGKISHLPQYFGGRNTLPENPQEGDWFTWTGGNLDPWYTGQVYLYTSGNWTRLDPKDVSKRSYFMLALEDILAINAAGPGYFSTVFAEAFFANSATLDSLAVKTIFVRGNGSLQSDTLYYTYQRAGLKIKSNGDMDANGDTHIAGKVAIGVDLKDGNNQYMPDFNNYDVVIGGNTKITGYINAIGGSFNGFVQADGFQFNSLKPGNYIFGACRGYVAYGSSHNDKTSLTIIASGIVRLHLSIQNNMTSDQWDPEGHTSVTFWVRKKTSGIWSVIWEETFLPGTYSRTIDYQLEEGDLITCSNNADVRRMGENCKIICSFGIDNVNSIIKYISEEKSLL